MNGNHSILAFVTTTCLMFSGISLPMNGTVFASALSSVTGSNASVNHNAAANTMQLRPPPSILTSHAFSPASASGLDGQPHEELYLLESAARPPPPPPAPPSTPVIKQAMTQKHHNQLLQQLPKKLANGTYQFWRAPDYMWLDTAGRPTSPPPPPHTPQGSSAQIARKVSRSSMYLSMHSSSVPEIVRSYCGRGRG